MRVCSLFTFANNKNIFGKLLPKVFQKQCCDVFFVSRHRSDRRDLVYSRFPVYNLACVGHDRNRAKTAEPIEIPLGKSELELCIRWRVLWRHLENTIDRSVRLRR